jgi:hypothetical protein
MAAAVSTAVVSSSNGDRAVTLEELLILAIVHRCPGIYLARAAKGVLEPPLSALGISREAAHAAIGNLRQRRVLGCTQTPRGIELRLTPTGGQEFRSVLLALQQVTDAALTVAAANTGE